MSNFNGWANWETWNVASWVEKDAVVCELALECKDYYEFTRRIAEAQWPLALAYQTPDSVAWNDSALDTDALDIMISEL